MPPPLRPSPAFEHVDSQSAQALVDTTENRPAEHSVHVVPDVLASVSVTEPAAHTMHAAAPQRDLYSPALQTVQLSLPAAMVPV